MSSFTCLSSAVHLPRVRWIRKPARISAEEHPKLKWQWRQLFRKNHEHDCEVDEVCSRHFERNCVLDETKCVLLLSIYFIIVINTVNNKRLR